MTKTSLLTVLASSVLAGNAAARPHCGCVESTIGIGVDLTANYGLASAKFPNGTLVDIGRIDAPQAFTNLYNSEPQSATFAPCETYEGRLSLRKIFQGVRNYVLTGGQRPVCRTGPNLDPLTEFLGELKDMIETRIFSSEEDPSNHFPKEIIITSANLPVMDLGDVAIEGGFRWGSTVSELQAAYHAIDGVEPGQEDELVLTIRATEGGLDVFTANFHNGVFESETPTSPEDPPSTHHVVMACNKKAQTAAILESKIKAAMPSEEAEINRVVLLGEKSDDDTLQGGLWMALARLGINSETYEMLQQEDFDSRYGPARGAAALGMRMGNCAPMVKVVILPASGVEDVPEEEDAESVPTIEIELDIINDSAEEENVTDIGDDAQRDAEDELKV